MDLFRIEDLQGLLDAEASRCVSIYQPTHRAGAEIRQDPIRLKNLLKRAEADLRDGGARGPEIAEILEPARELLEDAEFWQRQGDGLAMFLSPAHARILRLPLRFPELVTVNQRFHIKPLLQLFVADGRFWLLALSQNEVRLFHGSKHGMGTVELETVPHSLADAMKYEEPEKQLQFHTGTAGRIGRRQAIFHGHGAGEDGRKQDEILRYFRQIDHGLREVLAHERAPLLLAGVEYYFPIYREANTYPFLLDGGVHGNPERVRPDELHERAWAIARDVFSREQHDAAERFEAGLPKGKATSEVEAVVRAAAAGRIETLFVAVDAVRWGHYDAAGDDLQARARPQPGDEDLLDLAAAQTLRHGGTVYALDAGDVPGGDVVAATFRH